MTRWALVLAVIYTLVGLFGRFAFYLMVLVSAAASTRCELEPERFARLIPATLRGALADRKPTCQGTRLALAGRRATTHLGEHCAAEQFDACQNVVLRHPGPAHAQGSVGHPCPMLSEQSLDDLSR